jgi:hypothetical protein
MHRSRDDGWQVVGNGIRQASVTWPMASHRLGLASDDWQVAGQCIRHANDAWPFTSEGIRQEYNTWHPSAQRSRQGNDGWHFTMRWFHQKNVRVSQASHAWQFAAQAVRQASDSWPYCSASYPPSTRRMADCYGCNAPIRRMLADREPWLAVRVLHCCPHEGRSSPCTGDSRLAQAGRAPREPNDLPTPTRRRAKERESCVYLPRLRCACS